MTVLVQALAARLIGLSEELLTVLSACALGGRAMLLLGEHGCGKTTFCQLVAELFGWEGKWVYYNAAVDDMVTVMGLPDLKVREGKPLRFVCHERAIWDKHLVLIDEITRATPENQNMWLEIVGQGTLKGRKLPCRLLVATANPSTYAGAFELDRALLDRFTVVCPFPDAGDLPRKSWLKAVHANFQKQAAGTVDRPQVEQLREQFQQMRAALEAEPIVREQVALWCSELCHWLCRKGKTSVSGRTGMQLLPQLVLDLAAHELVRNGAQEPTVTLDPQTLTLAARFGVQEKLDIPNQVFLQALEHARGALARFCESDSWLGLIGLLTATSGQERVGALCKWFARRRVDELGPAQRAQLQLVVRETLEQCSDRQSALNQLAQFCRKHLPELVKEVEWYQVRQFLKRCVEESSPS